MQFSARAAAGRAAAPVRGVLLMVQAGVVATAVRPCGSKAEVAGCGAWWCGVA